MTISVLIADDQAMVRAGFAAVLAAQQGIEVVGPGRRRRSKPCRSRTSCDPTSSSWTCGCPG